MHASEDNGAPAPAECSTSTQRFAALLRRASPGSPTFALVLALAMVLAVVVWQASTLSAPICGEHNWRQADTYSAAYNFVHDGASFFYPKIDWSRGRSGVMGMETPIYAYTTALFMRVLGDGPLAGRLVNWLALLGGFAAIFFAFRATPEDWRSPSASAGPNPLWLPIGILTFSVFSPLFFFEGRQVQPDPMMGGLTAMAAACFHEFAKRERRWLYAAGMAVYCLAVGTKSPALVAGPSMWLLTWTASPRFHWRKPLMRGLPFVLPLALFWGWDKWAHHLNEVYNGGEVYFAISFDWRDHLARLRDANSLQRAFGFVVPSYASHWALFPVLVTGLMLAFRKGLRALSFPMLLWLVLGLALCAGSERLTWHWYYTFMFMLPLFYFGGVGVAVVFEGIASYRETSLAVRWGLWSIIVALAATSWVGGPLEQLQQVAGASFPPGPTWTAQNRFFALCAAQAIGMILTTLFTFRSARWVATMALVASAAVALPRAFHDLREVFLWRSRADQWPDFAAHWQPMRQALDQVSTREDVFVVDGGNPWFLHLALRKGFVQAVGDIDPMGLGFFTARGARFYLHFRENGRLPLALATRSPVRAGERWALYCIVPGGCGAKSK